MDTRTRADEQRRERLATDPVESAVAVAETVRSTLGPNGRDKMVVGRNGTVLVTNTGSRVLDRLEVDDPVGSIVVDAAAAQRERVGDGTTTLVLLVGELLAAARSLRDRGLHPTTIASGYRRGATLALDRLPEYAIPVDGTDDETDGIDDGADGIDDETDGIDDGADGIEDETLRRTAATSITGRWNREATRRFAEYTLASLRAVDFETARLTLHAYPGGDLFDSELIDGIAVDMDASSTSVDAFDAGLPRSYANPAIAAVDDEVTAGSADGSGTVSLDDPEEVAALRAYERESRAAVVRRVADAGVDVLVCQKSIDDRVRTALSRRGVLTVERARQDEFDAIARATGASTVMDVDAIDADAVGRAGAVHRRSVGGTELVVVADCPVETHASLLLRGGTPHVSEETRRILGDCVRVVQRARRDGAVLPGGGAAWLALSGDLSNRAAGIDGREQLAVEAFAAALEAVPRVLATNAGLDPIDALAALRSRHRAGESTVGVDAAGTLGDVREAGVLEPTTVVESALSGALETATQILRIDDVLPAKAGAEGDHASHAPHAHHGDAGGANGHGSHGDDHGGYPWAISH